MAGRQATPMPHAFFQHGVRCILQLQLDGSDAGELALATVPIPLWLSALGTWHMHILSRCCSRTSAVGPQVLPCEGPLHGWSRVDPGLNDVTRVQCVCVCVCVRRLSRMA